MHINLFLIPFIIFGGLMMGISDSPRTRKWYIILISAVLLFVASMRNPEWLTYEYDIDTKDYKDMFESSFDMGWKEFVNTFYLRYFMGDDEYDVGFVALNKLISLFTHEFWAFSLLADLLFFIPFGILLYKYCTKIPQIIFAFVFYVALIQVFFLGGARQMFALGFDLMSLLAIIDQKYIRAIFFFLMGVTIHFSSLLFVFPLLAIWIDLKPRVLKTLHASCFLVVPLILAFPNQVIRFMGNAVGMEKYAEYGIQEIRGGSETFIFLIEALSLFCLVAIKRKDIQGISAWRYLYVMAPLFTVFAPLIISNGSMIRISLYYHLFLALLVPYAIDCFFEKKNSGIVYAIAIGALSFLSLKDGGMLYYFFWQY